MEESQAAGCYALVAYVPGLLGRYLTWVRTELEPLSASVRAHVTVLPPRPFAAGGDELLSDLTGKVTGLKPIRIEAGGVELFEASGVVYLEIDAGRVELEKMHDLLQDLLHRDGRAFPEQFSYLPHITLAQDVPEHQVEAAVAKARELWSRYDGERGFVADTLYFVRGMAGNRWRDVATAELRGSS